MTAEKSPEHLLTKKLPMVARLNRKAVMVLTGVIVLVGGWILVSSLSSSTPESHMSTHLPPVASTQASPPAALRGLPSGYSDAAGINAVLARGRASTVAVPASVATELANLKNQQAALQGDLAALRASPTPLPVSPPSALDQEAMASSIFFAGGAPQSNSSSRNTMPANTSKTGEKSGASSNSNNPYLNQNMQQQKMAFLNSKPDTSIYDTHAVQYPASPYIIQAGTVIPAVLQTQVISDLPGNLVAIVRSDVYDSINGQYLLIPKGSRLIGEYSSQLSYGQDQIQVKFTRLIRPDGTSIVLPNSQGVNNMGVSGLSDEVNNHWGQVIGSAVLAAVFNIPAIVATNQQNQGCVENSDGVCVTPVGRVLSASALQSAGQTASDVGSAVTQRSLNLQPTVIVHAGYTFSVMVTKDMIIPPYQGHL